MPIHSGTATSHGNGTMHPANIADEVEGHDNFVPFEEVQNMDTVGDSDIQDGATSRLTPVASSNCSRKRPRPDVMSRKKKKKKDSVDEICSFLRRIAAALRAMAKNQAQSNIAKEICDAIDALPSLDFDTTMDAKALFLKELGYILLSESDDVKLKVVEFFLNENKDNIYD